MQKEEIQVPPEQLIHLLIDRPTIKHTTIEEGNKNPRIATEVSYVLNCSISGLVQTSPPGRAIIWWVICMRGTGRHRRTARTGGRRSRRGETQALSFTGTTPYS